MNISAARRYQLAAANYMSGRSMAVAGAIAVAQQSEPEPHMSPIEFASKFLSFLIPGSAAVPAYEAYPQVPILYAGFTTDSPTPNAIYGWYLPLWRDPNTGQWGFSSHGPWESAKEVGLQFAQALYSGATFIGDVMQGKRSADDMKSLIDFLTIPGMAMDFGGPFVAASAMSGIFRAYLSTMSAEDYARWIAALEAAAQRPDHKPAYTPPSLLTFQQELVSWAMLIDELEKRRQKQIQEYQLWQEWLKQGIA